MVLGAGHAGREEAEIALKTCRKQANVDIYQHDYGTAKKMQNTFENLTNSSYYTYRLPKARQPDMETALKTCRKQAIPDRPARPLAQQKGSKTPLKTCHIQAIPLPAQHGLAKPGLAQTLLLQQQCCCSSATAAAALQYMYQRCCSCGAAGAVLLQPQAYSCTCTSD